MQKRTNTIKTIKFDKGLYKGELKNDIPNGYGTIYFNKNSKIKSYTGYWRAGNPYKFGMYVYNNKTFIGHTRNKLAFGVGKVNYKNQDVVVIGKFSKGRAQKGIIYYKNLNMKFVGDFNNKGLPKKGFFYQM